MRPRGVPRGSFRFSARTGAPAWRFNEAAGRTPRKRLCHCVSSSSSSSASMRPRGVPRGSSHRDRHRGLGDGDASMRPRGVPRGSPRTPAASASVVQSFNEAAGRTPRKPRPALRVGSRPFRFNEAAGRTPRKRTARKSLCVNGLPWQLRAVSRRRVATARAARTPGVFLDHNYPVVKDLPALRALPGVAAAPQRSIRERRAAHQSYDDRFPPHGPFWNAFFPG